MKSIVVASVLILGLAHLAVQQEQSAVNEQQEKILKQRAECIEETGVDPELITRADKGDFADDQKLKCFTKCFYQKGGFVTESGEILVDVIEKQIPDTVNKDKALAVLNKCKEVKGQDVCDTIYLAHKCYFEENRAAASQQAPAAAAPAS